MATTFRTSVKAGVLAVVAAALLPTNAGAGCRSAPEGAGKPVASPATNVVRAGQSSSGAIAGVDDSTNYLYVDGSTTGIGTWARVEAGEYALIVSAGAQSDASYCADVKRVAPRH